MPDLMHIIKCLWLDNIIAYMKGKKLIAVPRKMKKTYKKNGVECEYPPEEVTLREQVDEKRMAAWLSDTKVIAVHFLFR